MRNLLEETLECMEAAGVFPSEVEWVGNRSMRASWANFCEIADFEYSAGFGSPKVADDLMIVGKDWWMTRGEYDGSEWWNFHRKPKMPENTGRMKDIGHSGTFMWSPIEWQVNDEGDS